MATVMQAPPITVEQYQRFEGYPGLRDELIYGRIVISPQPKPLHQEVVRNVERLLERALEGKGSFVVRQNSNVKFQQTNSMPAPDIFVVTREKWMQACESDQYLSEPPLLVVEVISPANRKRRVEEKVRLYLEEGVEQIWVVTPKNRTVLIYDRAHREGVESGTAILLSSPLEGQVSAQDIFQLDL